MTDNYVNKSCFFRNQAFIGNLLVAVSIIIAIMQIKAQNDYNKNFNAFEIAQQFVKEQEIRQELIIYNNWRKFFENKESIPKEEFLKLYPKEGETSDPEKKKIIFIITRLLNYYESIRIAEKEGVISKRIYEENFKPLIEKDKLILKYFEEAVRDRFKN